VGPEHDDDPAARGILKVVCSIRMPRVHFRD
jgi:hypothetical protein